MQRMTATQYRNLARKKPSKYHAQPTILDGIRFDSKAESQFYAQLKLWERAGEIESIVLQPKFVLQDKPKITYIADFDVTWKEGGREIIDVKGHLTPAFRIKKKLFEANYPELTLRLVKKSGTGWKTI